MKYADDINFLRTEKAKINQIKRVLPPKLKSKHLDINQDKTEEYSIGIGEDKWKGCKILGSLLDTEKDINRRRGLAIDAFKTMNYIFKSKHISLELKIRTFKTYVEPIFLYNCELWNLTKTLENKVNVIQRKYLRNILNIFWPKVIKNEDLYMITNCIEWSKVIRQRRLGWFGHLMRLKSTTPARKALTEYVRNVKRNVGRQKTTWFDIIYKDIKNNSKLEINFENIPNAINELENLCSDRQKWRSIVKCMML